MTTQSGLWPVGQAVEVPVLDRRVAVEYLLSRSADSDMAVAGWLADALGLLPLALAQAAAFLESSGRSLRDYLDLLETRRAQVLTRGVPAGYGKAVAGTWSAAFVELHNHHPDAVTLLRLVACYAPDLVPIRLLLAGAERLTESTDPEIVARVQTLAGAEFGVDDALAALRRYSLVSRPVDGARCPCTGWSGRSLPTSSPPGGGGGGGGRWPPS